MRFDHFSAKKTVNGLQQNQLIALLGRVAMRALPTLASIPTKEGFQFPDIPNAFWYWKDAASQKLFEIEKLHWFLTGLVLKNGGENNDLIHLHDEIKYKKIISNVVQIAKEFPPEIRIAYDILRLLYAIAKTALSPELAEPTMRAAFNAAKKSDESLSIHGPISNLSIFERELAAYRNNRIVAEFFQSPLWPIGIPHTWKLAWTRFKDATLHLDSIFEIWIDWYEERIQGVPIDFAELDQWLNIPAEINHQDASEFNKYIASLKKGGKPLNLVRALFIGHAGAGKTSLIRALHNEPVQPGKEKMTPGIDIRKWQVGDTQIRANLWDFGGQVFVHATHQFFLRERCLYVIVLDGRAERNANEDAEYWLEHVRAFGGQSRVIIVGNKFDIAPVKLDLTSLKEKYPNVIEYFDVSCSMYKSKYSPQFHQFLSSFVINLQHLDTYQIRFTEQKFSILKKIREKASEVSFVEKSLFNEICKESGLTSREDIIALLNLFDKLGIIIHFQDLPSLDSYILNPRWLTYGVYRLLYSKKAQEKYGRLREDDVINILSDEKIEDEFGNVLAYSKDKCRILIDAMRQFKLCYCLVTNEKYLIIPALTPSSKPKINFRKKLAFHFVFEFQGFIPKHILTSFIVSRYDEIHNNYIWQNGVYLTSSFCKADALIEINSRARTLELWFDGEERGHYFNILRDEFLCILNSMPELGFIEWIVLSPTMRIKPSEFLTSYQRSIPPRINFKQALALVLNKEREYKDHTGHYDLKKVLENVSTRNEKRLEDMIEGYPLRNSPEINIFISYSHRDEEDKKKLDDCLKYLKHIFPCIKTWEDSQLVAGLLDKQIKNSIEKADIYLALISLNFFSSDYCFKKELNIARMKNQNGMNIIIPIPLEAVANWMTLVGNFVPLPKNGKPLTSWKREQKEDCFWEAIQQGLSREIERLL